MNFDQPNKETVPVKEETTQWWKQYEKEWSWEHINFAEAEEFIKNPENAERVEEIKYYLHAPYREVENDLEKLSPTENTVADYLRAKEDLISQLKKEERPEESMEVENSSII